MAQVLLKFRVHLLVITSGHDPKFLPVLGVPLDLDEEKKTSLVKKVNPTEIVVPWFEAFVGARGTGKNGDTKMGQISSSYSRVRKVLTFNQVYQ